MHRILEPVPLKFSLTACLVGIPIGQIVIGPISDAQARKKPLLIATFLFALAPNIKTLIAARFLQGSPLRQGLFFPVLWYGMYSAARNLRGSSLF
jgi:MFS family permease